MTNIIIEHNVETGEIIEHKLTVQELNNLQSIEFSEPTLEQKLASIGLSVKDLKNALGL